MRSLLAILAVTLVLTFSCAARATESSSSGPLFGAGVATFGLSYAPALAVGAFGTLLDSMFVPSGQAWVGGGMQRDVSYVVNKGTWVLALPAIGPLTYASTHPGAVHTPLDYTLVVGDNVLQVAGLTMMAIAKLASRDGTIGGETVPVMDPLAIRAGSKASLHVTPIVFGGETRTARGVQLALEF